ncbi:DNA-formamidopyrimidine glycosylase [Erysipelothrix larvae]|uniref:Formamidopyrimidine-DNA glycosylase n=1 Tax=Erysipelothrix larvae TaxID=1514105 RepID=A0A120JTN2_9FIRM|nr:bifunctional DNA-formamidopyrimidine glycosylase/DNA-(apurinic or apyrimidinic site) lyase [Erysipelothrix larvae]AMC93421.1 DNA-formamidopyrimidine glycosylase [Erysipelothrix larvae]
MPELPEVETVVRTLEKSLMNETIESLDLRVPSLVEGASLPLSACIFKTFRLFSRRGKYLIFGFDDASFLVVHLRMEGKFHLYKKGCEPAPTKHTHLIFKTHHYVVHYLDTRKFSRFALTNDLDAYLESKHLGLEPFDEQLTSSYLLKRYAHRTRCIKTILLDQSIIAGIGNIYADEILFACKINPQRQACSLSKRECDKIILNTRAVLHNAILQGGTTIRSYTSSLDVSGRFQISLNAYGRKGKPCHRCQTEMVGRKIDGRSTVWCPKCQKV